jgi:hypothetical protein
VIFIRFNDEPESIFTQPASYYDRMLKTDAFSLRNYFQEVSYNKLTIESIPYPALGSAVISYKDDQPRGYYQPFNVSTNPSGYLGDEIIKDPDGTLVLNPERNKREQTLVMNAIKFIKGKGVFPAGADID